MRMINLLNSSRRIINPPYSSRDLLIITVSVLIFILIPLTTFAVLRSRGIIPQAAETASISLSPQSQSVNHNSNFTVEIREDSGSEPVNAVEANLSFDSAKLTFVSVDYTGSAFEIEAEETIGVGTIEIVRGTTTPVTGDQLVATITFQAGSSVGTTNVTFNSGTRVVSSNTNSDILGTMVDGTYTIVDPPPSVDITSPTNNQVVSGTISISVTASDDVGVAKVDLLVDDTLHSSDTSSPYSFSLDTTTLTDTTHTLTAKAYDANGSATKSITISVDNQPPTAPSGLSATVVSGTQIDLTWTASTDNIGVSGYEIYRDSVKIDTVTGTSYSDTGLSGSTTYTYFVKAVDGQGNVSSSSNTDSVTTTKPGDVNNDGIVDIFDLSILLSNWEQNTSTGDVNGDGFVDIFDLSILLSNWEG